MHEIAGQVTPLDNSYDLFTLSSKGQEPTLVSVTLKQLDNMSSTSETFEVLGAIELTITVTYGEQTKQLVVHVVAKQPYG